MEILKEVSIDWWGKRWYFFALSGILLALGIAGYFIYGGFALGIDFVGGTVVTLKFNQTPDLDLLRNTLKPETLGTTVIQRFGEVRDNSVMVRMQRVFGAGENVDTGHRELQALLRKTFDPENVESSLADINDLSVGVDALTKHLTGADPDKLTTQGKTALEVQTHYQALAHAILDFRNKTGRGLINNLESLSSVAGVTPAVIESLKTHYYAGPFAVTGVDSIGAVVGSDLRYRAALAVGLSFLGMLVYIGFRFKPIYGVGAIIALLHDVAITIGLFALAQMEISLITLAGLLTLVGYSVNDKIVIFDRVRENLRTMRKDPMKKILNLSINQTLARTIMTGGMTFLSVLTLLILGGEVLGGFAFALTVGILIGTYSSFAVASPLVEWWYRTAEAKARKRAA